MNEDVVEFIDDRVQTLNKEYHLISDEIRSKEIEVRLIEKKIKMMKGTQDDTVDILSPDHCHKDFSHDEVDKLLISKHDLKNNINDLLTNKNEVFEKLEKAKAILASFKFNMNFDLETNDTDSFHIQELDRERISRDIHDGVIQNLTALIRKMEFTSKVMNQDPSRAKLEIESSKEILKESVKELREIIYDLRPMSLNDLGFEKSFYDICEKIRDSYEGIFEFQFHSSIDHFEDFIQEDMAINLLRIVKELCSNSIKYSNGSKIIVELNVNEKDIQLIEYDNDSNSTFDFYSFVGAKNDNTGFGLMMLKERINSFHGTLKFDNEVGAKYFITFPLNIRR